MRRSVIVLVCGVVGLAVGWIVAVYVDLAIYPPDREGAVAIGAIFGVGPWGGFVGCALGVAASALFARKRPDSPTPPPNRARKGAPLALVGIVVAAVLAGASWRAVVGTHKLSHGVLAFDLRFRLPAGRELPAQAQDVRLQVTEADEVVFSALNEKDWRGRDGDRPMIIAHGAFVQIAHARAVTLTLPGGLAETWTLDLPPDPAPTADFTPWRLSGADSISRIEMSYRLGAD